MIRTLQQGQRCEVWIASVTGERELVFTSEDLLLEAPNWTLDGGALILNGAGKLWRLETAGSTGGPGLSLEPVPLTGIPDLNNDHVLAPDGTGIYLSANDGHIYRAPLDGGQATKITDDDGLFHFLHGVSPNGEELAYVGIEAGDFTQPGKLMTIPASGGTMTTIDVEGHSDGPEYSPDGEWLHFNTEAFTDMPGHAQLARIGAPRATDGGIKKASDARAAERLLESETVDWFPHISPDARFASYIRFPSGTVGHPADLTVDVVVVSTGDWAAPLHAWTLFGGQGTLNVNSWSPDSTRFAYVAYPINDSHATQERTPND